MKAFFTLVAVLVSASAAKADGFKCVNAKGDLAIQIFNQTQADLGTRNAAVMVLSNPKLQEGNKTIAVFRAESGLLSQESTTYVAKVDLRFKNSSRSGENVAGTKLGHLKDVTVAIAHNYLLPVAEGTVVDGAAAFTHRDGEVTFEQLACVRYLKGE